MDGENGVLMHVNTRQRDRESEWINKLMFVHRLSTVSSNRISTSTHTQGARTHLINCVQLFSYMKLCNSPEHYTSHHFIHSELILRWTKQSRLVFVHYLSLSFFYTHHTWAYAALLFSLSPLLDAPSQLQFICIEIIRQWNNNDNKMNVWNVVHAISWLFDRIRMSIRFVSLIIWLCWPCAHAHSIPLNDIDEMNSNWRHFNRKTNLFNSLFCTTEVMYLTTKL